MKTSLFGKMKSVTKHNLPSAIKANVDFYKQIFRVTADDGLWLSSYGTYCIHHASNTITYCEGKGLDAFQTYCITLAGWKVK
jgi:hypothetical protein